MTYDWLAHAACKDKPAAMFFGAEGEGDKSFDPRPAKVVCSTCPVREACLISGMGESDGVWGGMTLAERKRLKRGGRPKRCPSCKWLSATWVNGVIPPCCKQCDEHLTKADPHIEHLRSGKAYHHGCRECQNRARNQRFLRARARRAS